ncbi:MAG: ATP-dependent sacrificial sulfur transferase LarE [Spirochaetaceae bacterium]|jgi:uncharacterized protein|nr:ATP-dependent sacrificial sulfur transferase LarE [Spirochaetaceae bacterium]
MATVDEKYSALLARIGSLQKAAVAFSGGVDSSFLCAAAYKALGDGAIAVTVASPMLPKSELDSAGRTAALIGITHVCVHEDGIDGEVAANPRDRCYHCKKLEFGAIIEAAQARGITAVLDGSNIDDEGDYRPGLKALSELRVISPLREAGLTKNDVRELSRRLNLPTWDKPAFACLASRLPYGEGITKKKLSRIEQAEDFLRAEGFRQFRVRSHGDMARIEVAPEERRRFFDESLLDRVSGRLKALGFLYVAFELEGYRTGSLNRALSKGEPA